MDNLSQVIEIGAQAPRWEFMVTSWQMVAYAGATWDWHAMHHDAAHAVEHGLAGPVIDGQMFGGLFLKQIDLWFANLLSEEWRFNKALVRSQKTTYRGFGFAQTALAMESVVVGFLKHADLAEICIEQELRNSQDDVVAQAVSILVVPSRATSDVSPRGSRCC